MSEIRAPRRPDLRAIRVMICESEIRTYLHKYPQLNRDEIFEAMVKAGPNRAEVEHAIEVLGSRPGAKATTRLSVEAQKPATYERERPVDRAPHPSESVLRKL